MHADKICVNINRECHYYDKGKTLLEISKDFSGYHETPIVAAIINNDIKDMSTTILEDCSINFFDLSTEVGFKVYQRSLIFIMLLAARELFPNGKVIVEHSLSKGLYCEFHLDYPLNEHDVEAVESRMREIVEEDLPITKKTVSVEEAIKLFEAIGENEKVKLMKQMKRKTVNVYYCGEGYDYLYRTLVPSTGYIKTFELRFYEPGMILRYPLQEEPCKLPEFVEMPKLGKVFLEAERWAEIVECDFIGRLNEYVEGGEINNVILVAEALHEKKIAEIADYIVDGINRFKIILVTGPSSSGKTTFIQRLSIQLKVLGINTIKISLDDYFLDREKMGKLKDKIDFESIDVLDVALFNEHLKRMMAGEEIELPHFDFRTGKQLPSGRKAQIGYRKVVLVEGIHALNEKLTSSVPRHNKVKIHISAMTQIAIDEHNRIPTTDARLIRRIVRDSQFRNRDARKTIHMWPSVMRGEENNIFPYTEDADVMFNSALIYELAVLRNFAVPLLKGIGPEYPEHMEARRLIRLLSFFSPVTDAEIPLNSILREFIGKSCFFE
ncbi:MAG: nucleoside kinase [Acidaminococcaceae bacterium]